LPPLNRPAVVVHGRLAKHRRQSVVKPHGSAVEDAMGHGVRHGMRLTRRNEEGR
jgi:hypothetical protein